METLIEEHGLQQKEEDKRLAFDLRNFNVPLPSISTTMRSTREKDSPQAGVFEDVIAEQSAAAVAAGLPLSIQDDQKKLKPGFVTVNGVLLGETDYGGLRVDGKPDLRERRAATAAARSKVAALVPALRSALSAEGADAKEVKVESKQLLAVLEPVIAWASAAAIQLRDRQRACQKQRKDKEKRTRSAMKKKVLEERRHAEEEQRTVRDIEMTTTVSPQERQWEQNYFDAGAALILLDLWQPLLGVVRDGAQDGDGSAEGAVVAAALQWQTDQQRQAAADKADVAGAAAAAAVAPAGGEEKKADDAGDGKQDGVQPDTVRGKNHAPRIA